MSELLSQFLEEEIIPDVIMDALADYGERVNILYYVALCFL